MTRHISLAEAVRLLAGLPKLPVLAEGEVIESFEAMPQDVMAEHERRRGDAVERLKGTLAARTVRAWGRPAPRLGAAPTGPMEELDPSLFNAPDIEIVLPLQSVRRRPPAFYGGAIAPLWCDVAVDADALEKMLPKPGLEVALGWWRQHAEAELKRKGKPPKLSDAPLCVKQTRCTVRQSREAYQHLPPHLRNADRRKRNTHA